MKHISSEELLASVPVPKKEPMSRENKIRRWADLVLSYPNALRLMHSLEYWNSLQLQQKVRGTGSAMELAAADPILVSEGLNKDASFTDIMNFFEISQAQLHEFSCDCGGIIDNDRQAERIARLAAPQTGMPRFLRW